MLHIEESLKGSVAVHGFSVALLTGCLAASQLVDVILWCRNVCKAKRKFHFAG
jgi:hypothetical protein